MTHRDGHLGILGLDQGALGTDPIVTQFHTIRERWTSVDGHLRARLDLGDGSQLEFPEVVTYNYHWADASNQLIKPWYNAPHLPDLPGFPDHIHDGARG